MGFPSQAELDEYPRKFEELKPEVSKTLRLCTSKSGAFLHSFGHEMTEERKDWSC